VELPDEPVEKVKAYAVEAASAVLQARGAAPRGTARTPLRR
jgi:hypothetical protein